MVKRILVPFDGSPPSDRALTFAAEEWAAAELTLLRVINPVEAGYGPGSGVPSGAEQWFENARADATEQLSTAIAEADVGDRADERVEVGRPAQCIVEVAAEEKHDHVVMGSHGRTGVTRILLGSVTEAVIRESSLPVTVVR